MKKTILAITASLLFAGAAGGAAAQYYDDDRYYDSRTVTYDADVDRDGVPDRYDRSVVTYLATDVDRDGIEDRYDRYDNRYDNRHDRRYERYDYDRRYATSRSTRDRDCDGIPDSRDYNDARNYRDRDCDGIPNRFDRIDDRTYRSRQAYYAPRYVAPYGYRTSSRFSVGSYLPRGYYGSSYYVDYRPYGLSPPPYGYQWVRVGNDVYLTSSRNGLIAEVIYSLFR